MKTWPDKTPKSTNNAFDISLARPSGFDTGAEKSKAKRLNVETSTETCQAFAPMPGLSEKAQRALRVPKNRTTTVALDGSACVSRIPDIPKAHKRK